jgi:hypothetical protein
MLLTRKAAPLLYTKPSVVTDDLKRTYPIETEQSR